MEDCRLEARGRGGYAVTELIVAVGLTVRE